MIFWQSDICKAHLTLIILIQIMKHWLQIYPPATTPRPVNSSVVKLRSFADAFSSSTAATATTAASGASSRASTSREFGRRRPPSLWATGKRSWSCQEDLMRPPEIWSASRLLTENPGVWIRLHNSQGKLVSTAWSKLTIQFWWRLGVLNLAMESLTDQTFTIETQTVGHQVLITNFKIKSELPED